MSNSFISSLRNRPGLILAILLIITFIPFLGETLFNTKGEPREAIVAVSMLQSGDWILPVSNGTDIPYKPPMLAWCIAILSIFNGLEINEFISRLPSALSMIAMTLVVYRYTRRSTGNVATALMTALILTTMFEVHRAATNCRVDMLLTAFMVIAIYRLTLNRHASTRFIDIPSVLLLSGAVLTKGPVGMVIPCGITWIFMLVSGRRFLRTTLSMGVTGLASLLLPALWYIAAYNQDGREFLDLVIEENFGRMTGTMSYESHVNPWWYNILTLLAGMLPYTLLLPACPFVLKKSTFSIKTLREKWHHTAGFDRLMIIAGAFIFIFYCIPSSKRSVYLLPMYPMLAYGVARYIHTLYSNRPIVLKVYSAIIASLPILITVATCVIKITGPFGHKSTLLATRGLVSLSPSAGAWAVIIVMLVMSFVTWKAIVRGDVQLTVRRAIITTLTLYWSFSAFYQPAVLNPKSDVTVARELRQLYPDEVLPPSWLEPGLMRFYTLNFYLDNHLSRVDSPQGDNGELIVSLGHLDKLNEMFGDRYVFTVKNQFEHRSCDLKDKICIVGFQKIFNKN